MRLVFALILCMVFSYQFNCSSTASTPTRNAYNVLITMGAVPGRKYTSVGLITYSTTPQVSAFAFMPPVDDEGLLTEAGSSLREELSLEALEMGGDGIINLSIEEQTGGFNLIIPLWSYKGYFVKGEVVRFEN